MSEKRPVVVTVSDVVGALAKRFPPQRAEDWDRIGLAAGDPARAIAGVAFALDPTLAALDEAERLGCNVLVTHHPVALAPLTAVKPGGGPAGVVYAAVSRGIALVNAHTNLDRDARGQRLLPELLGLTPTKPLETQPAPMALVTAFVPPEAVGTVTEAMTRAGAGRIGDYEGCSFSATGIGSFTPSANSHPYLGVARQESVAEESRVEMVCPRGATRAVVAAAAAAHPYEEPLITAADVVIARNAAALGMVCEPQAELTLGDLAKRAATTFGSQPRVYGDADTPIRRVATATGSAGSLLGAARAYGVDALVAGEVRYHDALDAAASGVAIVELGHDVSEWPLVGLLAETIAAVPGVTPEMMHVLPARPAWWTAAAVE